MFMNITLLKNLITQLDNNITFLRIMKNIMEYE